MPNERRTIPPGIEEQYKKWSWLAIVLRVVHAALVIAATSASVLSAAGLGKGLSPVRWLPNVSDPLAALAAISIGLVSAFELGTKANDLRRAWRHLHAAIMRYQEEPNYPVEQLILAYEHAEKIIGDVKATPKPG